MSQQSTFLYSPHTRIRSSRPDAWSVQDVIQAGRSVRPPSPGKASAPLHMWVDTSSYAGACVVRPSKKSPIKGGTFALVSQSAFDSWVVNNPGPSWDFCPGLLCLARSPLHRQKLLSFHRLLFSAWGARRSPVDHRRLYQIAAVYRFRRNRLSQLITDLGVPSIVSVAE